jgi:hypothetical protein
MVGHHQQPIEGNGPTLGTRSALPLPVRSTKGACDKQVIRGWRFTVTCDGIPGFLSIVITPYVVLNGTAAAEGRRQAIGSKSWTVA